MLELELQATAMHQDGLVQMDGEFCCSHTTCGCTVSEGARDLLGSIAHENSIIAVHLDIEVVVQKQKNYRNDCACSCNGARFRHDYSQTVKLKHFSRMHTNVMLQQYSRRHSISSTHLRASQEHRIH